MKLFFLSRSLTVPVSIFVRRMSGQAKISSFFSPAASSKRKLSSFENTPENIAERCKEEQNPSEKRLKSDSLNAKDSQENVPSTPPAADQGSPIQTPKRESAFDKGAAELSPEQKSRIEENRKIAQMKLAERASHGLIVNMGPTWFKALESEFNKPYFVQLGKFVSDQRKAHTIYPPPEQVFSWTNYFPIREVKVVILGQDPYHGPKQAHGLCFSVQKGIPPPPSLQNMYKELSSDIEGFKDPGHGYLCGWSVQGVLLLNACLTVQARNANSHAGKGWEKFTDAVISWINRNTAGTVFILWGAYAQKKGACIDKKKHHVLKGVHPSPLSAHRGFFGCKHFSECNKLLRQQGKKPIDWSHLPKPE